MPIWKPTSAMTGAQNRSSRELGSLPPSARRALRTKLSCGAGAGPAPGAAVLLVAESLAETSR